MPNVFVNFFNNLQLKQNFLNYFFQNDFKIVKDFDVKNLTHKTNGNKRQIYEFITGPLDYGQTYKVAIFATTTTKEKGVISQNQNCAKMKYSNNQCSILGYPAEKLVHTAIPKLDDSNGTPYLYFTEGMYVNKI